jgi:putative membrane protein
MLQPDAKQAKGVGEAMQEHLDKDRLALERTLLAAERTFSAWTRTGLAMLGGGLAIAGAVPIKTYSHYMAARIIAGLLTILGAGIFVHAIIGYRRTYARLSEENLPSTLLIAVTLMTAVLLVIATLVFWLTLQ